MRIAFDVNGVLRDTFLKASQIYEKHYIDDSDDSEVTSTYNEEINEFVEDIIPIDFKYSLNLPVTSLDNLENHFRFNTKEDLFNFFYVDFPMQIFGHAPSVDINTFNVLNEIYEELREEHEIIIISDEIQKSKPATLFFLSKYGSLIEKIKFYSTITIDSVWDEVDVIITSNPNLIKNHPLDKIIIKYKTTYNEEIYSEYTIESIDEFKLLYKQLNLKL